MEKLSFRPLLIFSVFFSFVFVVFICFLNLLAINTFLYGIILFIFFLLSFIIGLKAWSNFQKKQNTLETSFIQPNDEVKFLKEKEEYRREFMGNISHELKTPLFSIQGFLLTLIEGGIYDINIRDRYLNNINKSVNRLVYLVNDLDIISKLEDGKNKLNYSSFNIVELAEEVIDSLEIKAKENNASLLFKKKYDATMVMADKNKIEQVLINLVENAIKHSNRMAIIQISFENLGKEIKVSVSDNGKGIERDELDRIFERFYTINKNRNRNISGSGLGLSIVKHILEAHDKKIMVDSVSNIGTKFYFHLDKA